MPLDRLTRWSGVAAAIGAPLFITTFSSHAFWGFMDDIGLAGNDVIHPLLAGIGLVLMGIALYGLFRRLPADTRPITTLSFGIAILGILLGLGGLVTFNQESSAALIGAAFVLPLLGIAGMGVITLSKKALGSLSFVPLAIVAAQLGVVASAGNNSVGLMSTSTQIFILLHHLGWLLLGVALMKGQTEEAAEPGVFA